MEMVLAGQQYGLPSLQILVLRQGTQRVGSPLKSAMEILKLLDAGPGRGLMKCSGAVDGKRLVGGASIYRSHCVSNGVEISMSKTVYDTGMCRRVKTIENELQVTLRFSLLTWRTS